MFEQPSVTYNDMRAQDVQHSSVEGIEFLWAVKDISLNLTVRLE